MSPPHKFPPLPDDEEVILESLPDIAAGVELPKDDVGENPFLTDEQKAAMGAFLDENASDMPIEELNEWERTGVRPPQAYR